MQIWLTSDWHLGHTNIIKFCGRPFANATEMDQALLDYHNQFVKPSDHVYNLGDLTMQRGGKVNQEAFIKQIKRFNGHKRLLLGNHDHFPIKTYLEAGFEKIYATWRGIGRGFIISHIPIHPGSLGSASANVHGHIHDQASPKSALFVKENGSVVVKPYINICVEVTNYRPLAIEEVEALITAAKEKDVL